jgi:hypothetical protein
MERNHLPSRGVPSVPWKRALPSQQHAKKQREKQNARTQQQNRVTTISHATRSNASADGQEFDAEAGHRHTWTATVKMVIEYYLNDASLRRNHMGPASSVTLGGGFVAMLPPSGS